MDRFGELIRYYRRQSRDPQRGGRLTQERLGALVGEHLGTQGYTGAAVSEWELGKSKIHKDDRRLLLSLLKAFLAGQGLHSETEANTFLLAGNYRPLNEEEHRQLFPLASREPPPPPERNRLEVVMSFLGAIVFYPSDQLQSALAEVSVEGPPPRWPRFLWAILSLPFQNWSSGDTLQAVFWLVAWLLTWGFALQMITWPFASVDEARAALVLYSGASLVAPLLVGALTRTRQDPFWQDHPEAPAWMLRLYTHQGAGIGFHLGMMAVFAAALAAYYTGLYPRMHGLAGVAAVVPVALGYAAARQVPFNLWRAFGRLRPGDGGIFFVFVFFGPLWSVFFYSYYSLLLSPLTGALLILGAIAGLAALMSLQKRKTGNSVIPAHVWAAIFGALFVLRLAAEGDYAGALLMTGSLIVAIFMLRKFFEGQ